jgi:glycerol-3-phosphate dehydrogenase
VLTLDATQEEAPLLSVFGGKITTYRRLAEAAMAKLAPHFAGLGAPWTAIAALPGGDFPWDGAPALAAELRRGYSFLSEPLARRLVRQYGTRARTMLGEARSMADLGRDFGAGLTEREVAWQMREEWARGPDDVLWRRTKLGLRLDAAGRAALAGFMAGVAVPAGRAAE